ncbi:YqzK family protein [Ectobacillus ponti]|uniref:YqzK family protein n=1 Tax=Ectobacillus ponti TaxID=2961894 RepID=A0AA41X7S9_9BACI|nr:YqzK family protein [Ectobacillus ponti]MCP8966961.1 YqzK family protein [Ectobacillus ponti]
MRQAARVMFDVVKVFILFTGCTVLFYFAILWVNEEYQSYHRYDKPSGETVEEVSGPVQPEEENWMHRLVFFYENGE